MIAGSASPDGRQLAFMQNGNLALLSLDRFFESSASSRPSPSTPSKTQETGRLQQLTNTQWVEDNPEISPDGRWLAYQSAEEGRVEVFVRSLQEWDKLRVKISTSGGRTPVWARNGRELFYLDDNRLLTSVPVQAGATFTAGKPVRVLNTAYVAANNRSFDISPDGQKFLMIKESIATGPPPAPPSIVVVTNWFESLNNVNRSN
jgi:Tol biopolymer transport system component